MAGSSFQTQLGTNTVYSDQTVTAIGPNYIVCSGSSANTLVATFTDIAGGSISLAAGQVYVLKTDTTLQAGANTLNVNGAGAKNIVNINGNNIKTTVASGAILLAVYDGTNVQLLNSTY